MRLSTPGTRGAGVVVAIVACLSVRIPTGATQEADVIALRGFRELPPVAAQILASKVEPSVAYVPPGGTTVEKMLASRCGEALSLGTKQVLAKELFTLNPGRIPSPALDAPLTSGMSIRFPFCAPVRGPTVVSYAAGTKGLEQTIKMHYPVWGPNTLELAAKLTEGCHGASLNACSRKLNPGAKVVLPFSASWVQGRVRPGATAEEILQTLTSLAPDYKENISKNWTSSSAPLEYVGSLRSLDLATTDRCSEPTLEEEKTWPFDREHVQERLAVSRAVYASKHPAQGYLPSHVAVIDSGLSEKLFNKLFNEKLFWSNEPEKKHGVNHRDDDNNFVVDDFHGIGASAIGPAGEGNFFALLDADDDQLNHGTKVATAIFGGAAMLESILAANESPPIVISFLRASWRLETGTVRPLPTFIPIAMKWLQKKNVAVVNLSMRHPLPEDEQYGLLYGDALFVAAAGNDGDDIERAERRAYPAYRGGMTQSPYITVGAHDRSFRRLQRSNFGRNKVDLLAPGCAIPVLDAEGRKVYGTGTSYAAPFVSLTAGILRSLGIRDPRDVRNRIVASTDFNVNLTDVVWSAGTLNIAKAVSIFEDIMEIRKTGRGPTGQATETLYGDLLVDAGRSVSDELARFCSNADTQRILRKSRVVKVSTYVDERGNLRLRYLVDQWANPERTLISMECGLNPRETQARFKIRAPRLPEKIEVFTIADIADVVPRRMD